MQFSKEKSQKGFKKYFGCLLLFIFLNNFYDIVHFVASEQNLMFLKIF